MKHAWLAVGLVFAAALAPAYHDVAIARACGPETHSAKGTVKIVPTDKKSVTIAHEAIPGYMGAMTMSFEVAKPALLDGLAAGDRVTFTFSATDDGRRVITQIVKQA